MKFVANPVIVQAWHIESVAEQREPNGGLKLTLDSKDANENPIVVTATPEMLARMIPQPGDYWVVQEDGYTYLNPKDVFERKYRLDEVLTPEDRLYGIREDFNSVIHQLGGHAKDDPEKHPPATRELALAVTKIDEAEMWVRRHVELNPMC